MQVFTSVPPLAIGLFDRTVTSESMLKYPKLYKESQNATQYNTKVRSYPTYFTKIREEERLDLVVVMSLSPRFSSKLLLSNMMFLYDTLLT